MGSLLCILKDADAINLEFEIEEDIEVSDDADEDYLVEECMIKKMQKSKQRQKKTNVQSSSKECVCEVCNKKLKTTSCLTTHMRTHTGERLI